MLLFYTTPNSKGGNYFNNLYYCNDTTVGLDIICFIPLKLSNTNRFSICCLEISNNYEFMKRLVRTVQQHL